LVQRLLTLRFVERDVELAIHHAADLARGRGGKLALITLRGAGIASAVTACALAVLQRMGMSGAEVRFEDATGPVRLLSVELTR
jgi:hypothetical protein